MVKLMKSGNYKEGIKMTVMFILSNIALALYYFSLSKAYATNSLTWIWFSTLSAFFYFALQSCAHWMFSYEYYNMVRLIPFVLEDITPPKNMVRCNRLQFWFWMILNTVAAFVYTASFYFLFVSDIITEDMQT